eukprot:2199872-Prymnesium_polylepis.1
MVTTIGRCSLNWAAPPHWRSRWTEDLSRCSPDAHCTLSSPYLANIIIPSTQARFALAPTSLAVPSTNSVCISCGRSRSHR